MGEQALAEGIIDSRVAEQFRNGTAGEEVVQIVKNSLARARGAKTASSEVKSFSSAPWRESSARLASPCWTCGKRGHFAAQCPSSPGPRRATAAGSFNLGDMFTKNWVCSSCQTSNPPRVGKCTRCLRKAPSQEAATPPPEPEELSGGVSSHPGAAPRLRSSGPRPEARTGPVESSPPCTAVTLFEKLIDVGLTREEAERLVRERGLQLPPPAEKPRSKQDSYDELKKMTTSLEKNQKEAEAIQDKIDALLDELSKCTAAITVLEADIVKAQAEIVACPTSQMDEAEPAGVIMPEAKEIQSVIANVRTAMLHQDLDCHYETYVAGEKAANRSPMGQFGWLRLVTANELAGCEKALEAIQARKDESERPRKKAARHDAEATAFEAERVLVPGAGVGSSSAL